MTKTLSLRVYKNIDAEILAPIFDSLDIDLMSHSKVVAPSLQKYWLLAFIRHYGSSRDLAITVVFENDSPKLLMPLQKKGEFCLEFLCDETADYNDFLFSNLNIDVLYFAISYWIKQGINTFVLNQLPPLSKTIDLLAEVSAKLGLEMTVADYDKLSVIVTQQNVDVQKWEGVKSHQINRYKRKLNTLNKISHVHFSYIETKSQLAKEFPAIRNVHISRWEAKGESSKYSDQRRESFILDVCENAINKNSLVFPLLKINGVLASYIIGFRIGDTIFDWNTGFSVDFFKWSPGALLLLHVLSNSQNLGFSKYNLMKGLEKHKFIWTDKVEKNLTVTITMSTRLTDGS